MSIRKKKHTHSPLFGTYYITRHFQSSSYKVTVYYDCYVDRTSRHRNRDLIAALNKATQWDYNIEWQHDVTVGVTMHATSEHKAYALIYDELQLAIMLSRLEGLGCKGHNDI